MEYRRTRNKRSSKNTWPILKKAFQLLDIKTKEYNE